MPHKSFLYTFPSLLSQNLSTIIQMNISVWKMIGKKSDEKDAHTVYIKVYKEN